MLASRGTARRRARRVSRLLALLVLVPAPAHAAEVVIREPDGAANEVAVEQGKSVSFRLEVFAYGNIACSAEPDNPATARVDTNVTVDASGRTGRFGLSAPLPFYSSRTPPGPCGVTWQGAPQPYVVNATLAADRRAPVGAYFVSLPAPVTNSQIVFPALVDQQTFVLQVKVIAPLAEPLENDSVNVYPSTGITRIRDSGGDYRLLTQPTHIPARSLIDTTDGHALLVSDADGPAGRGTQQVEVWAGYLRVLYSRNVFERPGVRAGNPITELRVTGSTGKRMSCRRARGAESAQRRRRRRVRRRRLWGRGRGRFRSRARHASGSVRGTTWYTEDSCLGSLIKVSDGTVRVRDFVIDRSFRIRSGQGYFAARPRSINGRN